MITTLLMQFADQACGKPKLLGIFEPWYQYLSVNQVGDGADTSCEVQGFHVLVSSDIPLVLLAVVDDLLRLAGLIAVGYVVYGGIQYATSQGNPDQTAKAQSTILNALIGLAIALIAVATVSFLGSRLSQ